MISFETIRYNSEMRWTAVSKNDKIDTGCCLSQMAHLFTAVVLHGRRRNRRAGR